MINQVRNYEGLKAGNEVGDQPVDLSNIIAV